MEIIANFGVFWSHVLAGANYCAGDDIICVSLTNESNYSLEEWLCSCNTDTEIVWMNLNNLYGDGGNETFGSPCRKKKNQAQVSI